VVVSGPMDVDYAPQPRHQVAVVRPWTRLVSACLGLVWGIDVANRVKILFTSVRNEADSPGQCHAVYVNTFLLKPWELVCGLYPPGRLIELVYTR
jgi:hypothetical protein